MAHRLYRRAAMTAVSFTVLVMAGAANAQAPFHNFGCPPGYVFVPSEQHWNEGTCRLETLMRRRNEIGVTGAVGRQREQHVGARPAVSRPRRNPASRGARPVARRTAAPEPRPGGRVRNARQRDIGHDRHSCQPRRYREHRRDDRRVGIDRGLGFPGGLGIGRGRGLRRSWPWLQRQQQRPRQRFRAGGQRVHRREGLGSCPILARAAVVAPGTVPGTPTVTARTTTVSATGPSRRTTPRPT